MRIHKSFGIGKRLRHAVVENVQTTSCNVGNVVLPCKLYLPNVVANKSVVVAKACFKVLQIAKRWQVYVAKTLRFQMCFVDYCRLVHHKISNALQRFNTFFLCCCAVQKAISNKKHQGVRSYGSGSNAKRQQLFGSDNNSKRAC